MREQIVARPTSSSSPAIQQLRRRLLQLIAASEADRKTSHKIEAQFARFARPAP